jgi:hypothetical protein
MSQSKSWESGNGAGWLRGEAGPVAGAPGLPVQTEDNGKEVCHGGV